MKLFQRIIHCARISCTSAKLQNKLLLGAPLLAAVATFTVVSCQDLITDAKILNSTNANIPPQAITKTLAATNSQEMHEIEDAANKLLMCPYSNISGFIKPSQLKNAITPFNMQNLKQQYQYSHIKEGIKTLARDTAISMQASLTINGIISSQRQSLIIQWNSAMLTYSEIIKEKALQISRMKSTNELLNKLKEIEETKKIAAKQMQDIENKIQKEMLQVQHEKYALSLNDTISTMFNAGSKHKEYSVKLEEYLDISNKNSLEQRKSSLPMDICIVATLFRNSSNVKKNMGYLKEIGQLDNYVMTLYKCLEKEFHGDYTLPAKEQLIKEFNVAYQYSVKGIFADHTKTLFGYVVMNKLYWLFSKMFDRIPINENTKNKETSTLWMSIKALRLAEHYINCCQYEQAMESLSALEGIGYESMKNCIKMIHIRYVFESVCNLLEMHRDLYKRELVLPISQH